MAKADEPCDLSEHRAHKAAQRLRKRVAEGRCSTCKHRQKWHSGGDGHCLYGKPFPIDCGECTCKRYKAIGSVRHGG